MRPQFIVVRLLCYLQNKKNLLETFGVIETRSLFLGEINARDN